MPFSYRKIIFSITYNFCLFFILLVGIQNSSNKTKVSLLKMETVELPVSFIVGVSFLTGSIFSSFIPFNFTKRE
jgi:uncharacterized integral membrane protein